MTNTASMPAAMGIKGLASMRTDDFLCLSRHGARQAHCVCLSAVFGAIPVQIAPKTARPPQAELVWTYDFLSNALYLR